MPSKSKSGQIRIIGGAWRGRKLRFSTYAGLRPTPDRVRETLFSWLQPVILNARCLDLFSGSGALGFEASSRGAAQVVMVERNLQACREIRIQLEILAARGVEVITADSLAYLRGSARDFDIVFLDPPFDSGLLEPCCQYLESSGWLVPGAYIYLEVRGRNSLPSLPSNWNLLRSKQAGEVGYYLARKDLNPLEGKTGHSFNEYNNTD